MLNKDSQRELAYVVLIDDIKPIEGADRVETAIVGGWRIMVRKDQFKPGDPAIYFEIDSKVPETEPFKFMESKGYKVKTQKYFKGTVISQGLLMSAEDFGWHIAQCREYKYKTPYIVDNNSHTHHVEDESRFLTKQLGVTYYDPEDNKRKATPISYSADKHRWIWKWLMKRSWGRWLLGKLGLQGSHKSQWPAWVKRSDEERIQNMPWILEDKEPWIVTEKVDGCLDANVSVVTNIGAIKISKIVNNKMNVDVLTYNESTGKCEYKPIEGYHKWERVSDMYDVVVSQQGYKGGNKNKHIRCTSEHSFYVGNNKYVKAKDLKETDTIYHRFITIDSYSKEILLGILLGDGSLNQKYGVYSGAVDFSHSIKQKEYFYETVRILGEGNTSISNLTSGYGSEILSCHYRSNQEFKEIVLNNCIKDNRKYVTESWANMLTPISLAFWYMDDGTIHNADDTNVRPTIVISTNNFSYEECENLKEALLNKFNIQCEIRTGAAYKGNTLYMNTINADKFATLIAPYICPSMKYKLPAYLRCINYCLGEYESTNGNGIIQTKIVSIEKIADYNHRYVFDLTVEGNHNYFANGILTHNTSTSFAMYRNKWPHKNDYYVCSRNVVLYSANQKVYYETPKNYYWEMAEKYHMKEVLEGLLKDFPTAEWVYIQGETYGEGVQKRSYSLKGRDLAVFNLVFSHCGRVNSVEMKSILAKYNVPCVPILNENFILPDTVDEMLEYADGVSDIDGGMREGVVLRSLDGQRSFKAVSNKYLLKYH